MSSYIRKVYPRYNGTWSKVCWVTAMAGTRLSTLTVRQSRADGQWYVTKWLDSSVVVLAGPTGSADAAVMLLTMGAVDLTGGN